MSDALTRAVPEALRSKVQPVALALALAACAHEPAGESAWLLAPALTHQSSGTDAALIAVSIVDRQTVWVSGARGTYARTLDGGETWRAGTVPGADSLQFRDVHAVSADVAYLLSIGTGAASRIYRTADGGATWTLQFTNAEPAGFFDCFGFWDSRSGMAFSDSFDGAFYLIRTVDGVTWERIPPQSVPAAHPGEGAFASSGTCLVVQGDSTAWVGTGASEQGARVLRTTDRGRSWNVAETQIVKGAAAGIATLAFHDARLGAALGGDIARADTFTDNVAVSADGGLTWTLAARPPFSGAVYGAAFTPGAPTPVLVATGPRGMALTTDTARTWMLLDTLNHWGVAMAGPDAGWAVGPRGRITRVRLYSQTQGGG